MGRATPLLCDDAVTAFEHYDWPGNVRELRNVVERALVIGQGGHIDQRTLAQADPEAFARSTSRASEMPMTAQGSFTAPSTHAAAPLTAASRFSPEDARGLRGELQSIERQRILDALAKCAGNQTQAAKVLGISRYTLMNRLEAYGIARPRKR
jgi:DNA-binding NtrC family response regulator